MDNLNTEIKKKILDFLKTTKIGASSSEISKNIGHNRITVTKYLEIMKAHKFLDYEGVAQAKLWYINKKNDKPTILIVDDEPHVVDLVALSLMSEKYIIIKAFSGLDALDSVYKNTPDLIILDLMMPGINGYEVCQKNRENALTQHIPIIILSAKGEIEDKLHGLKIGADDYITKPFDPMELEARVERIIRRSNQDQDIHPLTKLPGKLAIQEYLGRLMINNKTFTIYNFTIKNFSEYNKNFGFKKGDHLLEIISRVFSDSLNGDESFFLGHTIKDNFVIITNNNKFLKKVNLSFEKILPYLYDSIDDKKIIELDMKKLLVKDKNGMNPIQIITKLGVN